MIARLRTMRASGDAGFALVFVLMVTTVIMVGLTTIVTPNVPQARQGQYAVAAMAAARAGVDDVIAYLVSVPSCRSESRICPAALGQTTDKLAAAGKPRPAVGNGQTFSWATNPTETADGYLRVTSTGTAGGVTRRLVADLSLRPSILAYGYYTDYETQPAKYFDSTLTPGRTVYLADSTAWSNVTTDYRNSASAPQTATWNGPTNTARCDRHWYYEGTTPGREKNGTTWGETGSLTTGKSTSRTGGCDLVFSSAMVEDGLTYSRDAMNVSAAGGTGPTFNQPVFTMWGYNDGSKVFNNPAPTTGKYYRGDNITNGGYKPAIAAADLTLPSSIGSDGMPENTCVYYGPTRVVLQGNGKALVTSPETTTKNAASDPDCYPTGTLPDTGITRFTLDYSQTGGGAIQVKNLGTAPTLWPANPTKATNTLSPTNTIFYYPPAAAAADAPSSAASDSCASGTYSAAASAVCAWTNIRLASDGGGTNKGWATYTATTCSSAAASPTNRQVFECDYGQSLPTATPALAASDQGKYATVRTLVKNYLAAGNCVSGTPAAQGTCLQTYLNTVVLPQANTAGHGYNYASALNGDRQYFATVSTNTATTGTAKSVGGTPTNPNAADPFFAWTGGAAAQETPTYTPLTVTVYRQVRANGAWSTTAGANYAAQFSFTDTNTTWNITTPITGTSYFPNLQDVTAYNTGVNGGSTTPAGSSGTIQPGDLYVEGANSGKLSLLAQNDVVVTGNIGNPSGTTADTDAISIVAGDDVRNYHPVSCKDQVGADIDKTTPGFCPNDITGLTANALVDGNNNLNASHPAKQYVNMQSQTTFDRNIDAAVFALTGSLRTDNYDRGVLVGNLVINGGLYQSHRGANGVQYSSGSYVARSGTTLQYNYVDLQRAELPYVPPSTSGNYTRPWNVVSISSA